MNRLLKYLIEILIMFGLYVVCDNPGTKKYIVIAMGVNATTDMKLLMNL